MVLRFTTGHGAVISLSPSYQFQYHNGPSLIPAVGPPTALVSYTQSKAGSTF